MCARETKQPFHKGKVTDVCLPSHPNINFTDGQIKEADNSQLRLLQRFYLELAAPLSQGWRTGKCPINTLHSRLLDKGSPLQIRAVLVPEIAPTPSERASRCVEGSPIFLLDSYAFLTKIFTLTQ